MDYKLHFIIGFALGIALSFYLKFQLFDMIYWALAAGLAALLPDIDHEKSKATFALNLSAFVFFVWLSFSLFSSMPSQVLFVIISFFAYLIFYHLAKPRHRGITHSLLAVAVVTFCSVVIFKFPFFLFVPVGYLSHNLADGMIKIV